MAFIADVRIRMRPNARQVFMKFAALPVVGQQVYYRGQGELLSLVVESVVHMAVHQSEDFDQPGVLMICRFANQSPNTEELYGNEIADFVKDVPDHG